MFFLPRSGFVQQSLPADRKKPRPLKSSVESVKKPLFLKKEFVNGYFIRSFFETL
jgi:hypothetical protein